MSVRRKRALLAGIEGQLAAMKNDVFGQRRWPRIRHAIDALRDLPRDEFETARLAELQRQIMAVLKASEDCRGWLREQRLTLARADCIIWQMHLRRHSLAVIAPGTQWPPRMWTVAGDPATVAGSVAAVV